MEAPAPLDLDADISAEEMQMMQAMGIPFGFNTTQVQAVQHLIQITCQSVAPCAGWVLWAGAILFKSASNTTFTIALFENLLVRGVQS